MIVGGIKIFRVLAWALFGGFVAIYAALARYPDDPLANTIFSNTLVSLSSICAVSMLVTAWSLRRRAPRIFKAWLFLGLAFAAYATGDILSHICAVPLTGSPLCVPLHAAYLLFYPLFLAGVSKMPFSPISRREKVNLALDMGIGLLSATVILWTLVVEPTLARGESSLGKSALMLAFPIGDLALLWAILALLFNRQSARLKRVSRLLATSAAFLIVSDLGFGAMVLEGRGSWALFAYLGYPISHALAIMAAFEQVATSTKGRVSSTTAVPMEGPALAPVATAYISLVAALLVQFWGAGRNIAGLAGILCIVGLVLARQVLSFMENGRLYNDMKKSRDSLDLRVRERTAELQLAYDETLQGLSKALELRDRETQGHTLRVAEMAVRLARELGLGEHDLVHVWRGGVLHDIGKMGIPDGVLLKPGPLDEEEWELMRKHPEYACEVLESVSFLKPALDIPKFHHERWDGSGYPEGLKGEKIPLTARIFAVLDVWDALTHDRPYRSSWPREKVLDFISQSSGTRYDPEVVRAFLAMIAEGEQEQVS